MQEMQQKNWLQNLVHDDPFLLLFISLILFYLGTPLIRLFEDGRHTLLSDSITAGLYMVFMLTAIFTVSKSRRSRIIGIAFAIPVALLSAGRIAMESLEAEFVFQVLAMVYLCYSIVLILKFIFDRQAVNANKIFAALCVYLLISLLWALLYSMIELLQPTSFIHVAANSENIVNMNVGRSGTAIALYYSLVTMTTLGYGDIIPANEVARMFASLQAVIGQLYIAVLIARLVGLHAAQNTSSS